MTTRCVRRPSGIVLAALAALVGPGAARSAPADDARASKIRERLQPLVDRKEIAGAVVLVGDAEKVIDLVVLGERDAEAHQPMRPDTVFRIASMTKPVTAIGVMMLAEAGKLSIDDPVEKYLPEFQGLKLEASRSGDTLTLKEPSRKITVRDLLTHTSGLPDSVPPGRPDLASRKDKTLAEAVAGYAQRPLSFEPGSKWSYSNSGLSTLGRLVEAVSGRPYEAFLDERLFKPLGMADTTFYPTEDQTARLAVTYEVKDGALKPVAGSTARPTPETRYPGPAGGLYSTGPDYAKLCRMLLRKGALDGRRYLSESTVAEMTRTQTGEIKTGFTDGMSFGLGFGVVKAPAGVSARLSPGSFGHGGAWGTQAWVDPHAGRFALLMIQRSGLKNSDDSDARKAVNDVAFDAKD